MNRASLMLFVAVAAAAAAEIEPGTGAEVELGTGEQTVVRDGVTYALHVPAAAAQAHGALGLFVMFGGYGDAVSYYQTALAPLADDLEVIVAVPQLPWFREPGKVGAAGILDSLDRLRAELAVRFHTDPKLVIVSGASAGGPTACELVRRWSPQVALLVLHSTRACSGCSEIRSYHFVGEREVSFLGPAGRSGKLLGKGLADLYAVPHAGHEVHLRHLRWALETELSAWRLDHAAAALARAEQADAAEAGLILGSLRGAAARLATPLADGDDFVTYQNACRLALRQRLRSTIDRVSAGAE